MYLPEISYMKDRQLQGDVAEVSDAVRETFSAGGALLVLLTRAHPVVQNSVRHRRAMRILKKETIRVLTISIMHFGLDEITLIT
jgi:hypothetical protein